MNKDKKDSINNNKSDFVEKIKSVKYLKIIILLVIVALVVVGIDAYVNKNKKTDNYECMTETEIRLSKMLSEIEGIDDCEVYLNYGDSDSFFGGGKKIEGVLVVCHGTNTVTNKLQMLSAIQKALNVNKDLIEILIL
ncbi:MAG: hypothetical protein PUK83_03130 [Clostridia bacterium]|nr:hypothetical protein [Clostridia bacterium]MDY5264761.1 hypothetical protein [Eubacteriales bacterium]MDY5439773.1 hypothetical protein [Eubacteriales bacterium]